MTVSFSGLLATLALAAPATASAYVNPFSSDTPLVGRTDMGVDVCLSPGDPIRAIGDGTVVGIMRNWYAGQPYIWYELTGGPHAGAYVYVAEQIDHLARTGQALQAGDVIARYAGHGTCIEIGWSLADGSTQAQATTGYTDGQATTAGVSFARFLLSLGVSGQFNLSVSRSQAERATSTRRQRRHRSRPDTTIPKPHPVPTPRRHPVPIPKPHPVPTPRRHPVHIRKPHPSPTPAGTPAPSTPAGPSPGPDFSPGNAPYWPSHG